MYEIKSLRDSLYYGDIFYKLPFIDGVEYLSNKYYLRQGTAYVSNYLYNSMMGNT